ncbi:MAG TPA: HigA family addiction module antitoxin [Dongiaceae bacterium]|jgi:addiction module HigA family antidote|nr:HigA family addiction module antitoxin [Dongiaceae bacterium]
MSPINKLRPVHPGEILADELRELGLTARAFAAALRVPHNRITAILNEQRGISADTALRLAAYFGTGPEFWMSLQQAYDLKTTEAARGAAIRKQVRPRAA